MISLYWSKSWEKSKIHLSLERRTPADFPVFQMDIEFVMRPLTMEGEEMLLYRISETQGLYSLFETYIMPREVRNFSRFAAEPFDTFAPTVVSSGALSLQNCRSFERSSVTEEAS